MVSAEAYKKVSTIHRRLPDGGILVFLTGQDEITDLCARLKKRFSKKTTRVPAGAGATPSAAAGTAGTVPAAAETGFISDSDGTSGDDSSSDDGADNSGSGSGSDSDGESDGDAAAGVGRGRGASARDDDTDSDVDVAEVVRARVLAGETVTRGSVPLVPGSVNELVAQLLAANGVASAGAASGVPATAAATKKQQKKRKKDQAAVVAAEGAGVGGDGAGDVVEEDMPVHVLPLYALLPRHEQRKVFKRPPAGHRAIIVSTNVAETSVTIPGIR